MSTENNEFIAVPVSSSNLTEENDLEDLGLDFSKLEIESHLEHVAYKNDDNFIASSLLEALTLDDIISDKNESYYHEFLIDALEKQAEAEGRMASYREEWEFSLDSLPFNEGLPINADEDEPDVLMETETSNDPTDYLLYPLDYALLDTSTKKCVDELLKFIELNESKKIKKSFHFDGIDEIKLLNTESVLSHNLDKKKLSDAQTKIEEEIAEKLKNLKM